MGNDIFVAESVKCAARCLGKGGVTHRVAAHIALVEYRLSPRHARAIGQCFGARVHDTLRHVRGAIGGVDKLFAVFEDVVEHRRMPAEFTGDFTGVRIEQQFGRVTAQAVGWIERPVHAVAVRSTGRAARHIAVPDTVGALRQEQNLFLLAGAIKKAEFDLLGHCRINGEVGAVLIRGRPQDFRIAGVNHFRGSSIGSRRQISSL